MSLERLLEQNKNKDSGIRVPDNWEDFAYSSDKFAIPEQYKQYIDHVMLPRGLVMDRTEKMGKFFLLFFYQELCINDYLALDLFNDLDREKPITALCVLKGGYQYFVDVMKYLKQFCATMGNRAVQINVEFIRLKSYEGEFQI